MPASLRDTPPSPQRRRLLQYAGGAALAATGPFVHAQPAPKKNAGNGKKNPEKNPGKKPEKGTPQAK